MLLDLIKRLLYISGALMLYHRVRNSRSLTVIMFHRVLDSSDPRWESCDPDYTLRVDHFEHCLRFFSKHYNTVSVEDVLAARRGAAMLPARALLVTFDDGWADTLDFAVPCLRKHGIPALMFVVADAVNRRAGFFQEQIVGAWRRGAIDTKRLASSLHPFLPSGAPTPPNDAQGLRSLIARVEGLGAADRERLLESLRDELSDELRHMVSVDELRKLDESGVSIGLHGKTHTPMTLAPDLDAELAGARNAMAAHMAYRAAPTTMSFPHGRFDAAIAERARASGYELVFTSVPVMNPTAAPVGWLLGRLGFETASIVDGAGTFRADWLALNLFRRPCRLID